MRFNIEQRVFLIETYAKKPSCSVCRYKFIQKFPGVNVPSKSTIERLVKKFRSTGSVLNKKTKRRRSVLTEEKLDEIGAVLEKYPRKSLRHLAEQSDVSFASVRTATRLLQLRPYKAIHSGNVNGVGAPNIMVQTDVKESEIQNEAVNMNNEKYDKVVESCFNFIGIKEEPICTDDIDQVEPDLTTVKVELTIDDCGIALGEDQCIRTSPVFGNN